MTDLRTETVAVLRAVLSQATQGRPVQFHPNYCPEAKDANAGLWDSSHDLSVITPEGKRRHIATFTHAIDACLDQEVRTHLPAMLDAIAALEAQLVELRSDRDRAEARVGRLVQDQRFAGERHAALTARAEAAEAKVAELTADLNALRVEAEKAFGADDAIAEAWDAFGTRGNPKVLSLAEQVSSIIRELDAVLAEIGGGNGNP